MTRPMIEPWPLGPLVNTLLIRPRVIYFDKKCLIRFLKNNSIINLYIRLDDLRKNGRNLNFRLVLDLILSFNLIQILISMIFKFQFSNSNF